MTLVPIMSRIPALLLVAASATVALGQNTWQRQSPLPTDRSAQSVFAIGPDKAFFVGENKLKLYTSDSGAPWPTPRTRLACRSGRGR